MRATHNKGQTTILKHENFLRKLEMNIFHYKKRRECKDLDACTVLHIAGKEYGLGEFNQVCNSFLSGRKSDDTISIITLRNFYTNEAYNAKDYMHKFSKAMYECINENKRYALVDNLGLTIEHIEQKYLDDFAVLSTSTNRIYDIHRKFQMLVLNKIPEICFDTLKNIFIIWIHTRLVNLEVWNDHILHMNRGTRKEHYEDDFKAFIDWLNNVVSGVKEVLYEHDNLRGIGTAFNDIYSETCKFEEEITFKHFMTNEPDAYRYLWYLLKISCREIYQKCLNNLIASYIVHLQEDVNLTLFINLYKDICQDSTKHSVEHRMVYHNDLKIYLEEYFKNEEVLQKFNNFSAKIRSPKIHDALRATYKDITDGAQRGIMLENVTQILYNVNTDTDGAIRLINIIKSTKLFEVQQKCQSICIDTSTVILDREKVAFSNMCDTKVCNSVFDGKIELFSLINPSNENEKCSKLVNFTYNRRMSEEQSEGVTSYSETDLKSNETTITLKQWDDQIWETTHRTTCLFKDMCLANNESKITNIHEIIVQNGSGISSIIVIRHLFESSNEIVSFIHNMPNSNQSAHTNLNDSKRRIRCLDNVPMSFLNDLNVYLFSQVTAGNDFKCPNLFSISNVDMIYSEHRIEMGWIYNMIADIRSEIRQTYKCESHHESRKFISIKQILEFKEENIFGFEEISSYFENMGISKANFNQAVRTLLFEKGYIIATDPMPNALDSYQLSREIDLFVTEHNHGTMVVHFCETNKNRYIHNLTINLFDNFTKIMKCQENLAMLAILENLKKQTESNESFIVSLLNDICRYTKYSIRPNGSYFRLSADDCKDFLLRHIEDLFKTIESMIKSGKNTSGLPPNFNLSECRQSITESEAELNQLTTEISESLYFKPSDALVKVLSVRITTCKGSCERDVSEVEMLETDKQYEDVSYLGIKCLNY